MPPLKLNGLTFSKNKVWSSNTGRASNAEMVGDLVAIKNSIRCEWPPLTRAQVAVIDQAVSTVGFFSVTYTDPRDDTRKTITCYADDPSYPVYSYVDGVKTYQGVAVELIEK